MAGLAAIRKALVERLSCIPEVERDSFYWFTPSAQPVTPAILVIPDKPYADFTSRPPKWFFVLTVLVDPIDEEDGQEQLDELVSEQIVPLLRSEDFDDSLQRLSNGCVLAAAGVGYQASITDYTNFLQAQVKVTVWAN